MNGVLFDLDGTLLDTAPALAFALNTLLQEQGKEPLEFSAIRAIITLGVRGLLALRFKLDDPTVDIQPLQTRFLSLYAQHIAKDCHLFPGVAATLSYLQQHHIPWGIVTNKHTDLTQRLLSQVPLPVPPACIVCGDTLAISKPNPAPLLHACQLIKRAPTACIYIGDAQGDIEAGQRAGLKTMLAHYGYLQQDDQPHTWGADYQLQSSGEMLAILANILKN